MPLRPYSCANCGHWQRWFAEPPFCPVCTDVRNALPDDGWEWITPDDLADRQARWTQVAPGVCGYWVEPQVGLGTTGWVIETDGGLVGWEGAGFYPPAALDELRRRGGLVALGASHVHGYGALWQLQDELAPPVLAIGVDDLQWTKAFRVTWPTDDRHELAPGLVMHRSGGHFPGHTVLHDERRGILFVGDLLKVDLDGDDPRRPVVPQGVPRPDPAVARRDPAGPGAGRAAGVRRRRHAVRVRRAGVDQAGAGAVRPPARRAADRRARSRCAELG